MVFRWVNLHPYAEVEQALREGGADPGVRDQFGNTILAVATQNNRKRIVKAAVKAGTPLDAQNHQGQTALHFAYAYGYADLAEYLVQKGADQGVANVHGLLPSQGLAPDKLL